MTELGEWIEWEGGACPVSSDTKVEVECDDGYRAVGPALNFTNADGCGANWWARNVERRDVLGRQRRHPDDIIAYRVVSA